MCVFRLYQWSCVSRERRGCFEGASSLKGREHFTVLFWSIFEHLDYQQKTEGYNLSHSFYMWSLIKIELKLKNEI